jgi:hypothetical protein
MASAEVDIVRLEQAIGAVHGGTGLRMNRARLGHLGPGSTTKTDD